ncbi:YDG/SRA domain-containing protein [Riemerella anatipestifer]|nr:YDG/SRA domain-containing protein [Riemerella anatipestifer]MDY3352377.1 YDG/SRA domain-containing protein [Riemerella anatipestifer]MDY3358764.1 YDG/SRA domain-containing protein [Riemerella anatipestifer]
MSTERNFGEIDNIFEGDIFNTRIDLSIAKVHKPTQAGISGSQEEGADSIVVSGGYEDDEDLGDIIIYTGHGGRSNESKYQVADQTLTRGNKALAISCEKKLPVRVIRGAHKNSKFAPESGYRYDGLYYVTDYWHEKGKSGFIVWRFRLEKVEKIHREYNEIDNSSFINEPDSNYGKTERKEYIVNRIVRETKTASFIKKLYDHKCQICGIQIITPVQIYAEAAHIKALGKPHNGPDTKENILCLCPNHHTMLDLGIITIEDDFTIIGFESGKLNIHPNHKIDLECIKYHREHHYKKL